MGDKYLNIKRNQKIIQFWRKGLSAKEVAKKTNIKHETVWVNLWREGLPQKRIQGKLR